MTFEAMFRKLEIGYPPALTGMVEIFDSAEYLTAFIDLIDKFLPDRKERILRVPGASGRCMEFVRLFSKDYSIELGEYDYYDEAYQQLLSSIPIVLEGLGYSDYDDLNNFSPEWVCMAALISYPYYTGEGKDGASERIPILEEAAKIMGSDVSVNRIPAAGFKPEELHKKLDKTQYEGLAHFADWLHADTGVWKLDVNYEDNPEGPYWEEDTVEELVRQEPIKNDIQEKILKLESWLHEDIRSRFAELVNAIMGKPIPKEQLNLPMEEEDG